MTWTSRAPRKEVDQERIRLSNIVKTSWKGISAQINQLQGTRSSFRVFEDKGNDGIKDLNRDRISNNGEEHERESSEIPGIGVPYEHSCQGNQNRYRIVRAIND